MTNEEICRHYRLAKDKRNDIAVLADLNQTDQGSIRAILIDAQLLEPDKPKSKWHQHANRTAIAKEIERMLDEGKGTREIAETLGCTTETVRNHVKRRKMASEKADDKSESPDSQPRSGLRSNGTGTYLSATA